MMNPYDLTAMEAQVYAHVFAASGGGDLAFHYAEEAVKRLRTVQDPNRKCHCWDCEPRVWDSEKGIWKVKAVD